MFYFLNRPYIAPNPWSGELWFIDLFSISNVGEAFRLPAVKHYECAEKWGEFVIMYRRDGKPVPYNSVLKQPDKLKFEIPYIMIKRSKHYGK